ncbi:MAG: hypothetical protein SFX72_18875 [Isosphaeraceae bacterium]|nr:hypothetical protein [Isosphaeraceae bacterium]
MKEAERRGCYCGLWETKPEVLEGQGVARGYCGKCEVCGAPGHTRHFPGSLPYTGAWCDRHYRRIALTHPGAPLGCLLWMLGLVGLAAALRGWVR